LTAREKALGAGQIRLRDDHTGSKYKYDVYKEDLPYASDFKRIAGRGISAGQILANLPPFFSEIKQGLPLKMDSIVCYQHVEHIFIFYCASIPKPSKRIPMISADLGSKSSYHATFQSGTQEGRFRFRSFDGASRSDERFLSWLIQAVVASM
jgi:hypothetical protein